MAEQLELDLLDYDSRQQILEDRFYDEQFQDLQQEAPDSYIPPAAESSNGVQDYPNPYDDFVDDLLTTPNFVEEQTFVQDSVSQSDVNGQGLPNGSNSQGPWAFEYIVFQDASNSNTPVAVLASNYRFDNGDQAPDSHLYAMAGIYAKSPEGAIQIYEDRELYRQHPGYKAQTPSASVDNDQTPDTGIKPRPKLKVNSDPLPSLSSVSGELQGSSSSDELKASAVAKLLRDYSLNAFDPKTGQKMTSTIGVVRVPKSKEGIENVPVFESRAFPQSNLQHSYHKDINDEALNWVQGQFRKNEVTHTFTNVQGEHLGVKYTATQVNDFSTGKYVLNVAYGEQGERTYQHIGDIAAVQNKLLDFRSKQPPINQFFSHLAQQKAPHISEDGKLNLAIR